MLFEWLPDDLDPRSPDVTVDESDGDFLVEWYVRKDHLMCVWNRDGHVAYAGIVAGQSLHGRSNLREVIPHECLEAIELLEHSYALQRTGDGNG
jgi:hypothetical protein